CHWSHAELFWKKVDYRLYLLARWWTDLYRELVIGNHNACINKGMSDDPARNTLAFNLNLGDRLCVGTAFSRPGISHSGAAGGPLRPIKECRLILLYCLLLIRLGIDRCHEKRCALI